MHLYLWIANPGKLNWHAQDSWWVYFQQNVQIVQREGSSSKEVMLTCDVALLLLLHPDTSKIFGSCCNWSKQCTVFRHLCQSTNLLLTSYQLYQDTLCYTPTMILPKANQQWQTASLNTCYSSTYHTHFPSQWAMQALTLNISIPLITYLQHNIPKQLNDTLQWCHLTQATLNKNMPHFLALPVKFLLSWGTCSMIWKILTQNPISLHHNTHCTNK